MKIAFVILFAIVSTLPIFAKWNAIEMRAGTSRSVTVTYISKGDNRRFTLKSDNGKVSASISENGIDILELDPISTISAIESGDFEIQSFTIPSKGFSSVFSEYRNLFMSAQ